MLDFDFLVRVAPGANRNNDIHVGEMVTSVSKGHHTSFIRTLYERHDNDSTNPKDLSSGAQQ